MAWNSSTKINGWPLLSFGFNAKGIIAIGWAGIGVVTIAQFGIGVICITQFGAGIFCLAQFSVAMAAISQMTISGIVGVGQLVISYISIAQSPVAVKHGMTFKNFGGFETIPYYIHTGIKSDPIRFIIWITFFYIITYFILYLQLVEKKFFKSE